jgi:hypothetical protein
MVRKALATALTLGLSTVVTVACKSTDGATSEEAVSAETEETTEVAEQGETADAAAGVEAAEPAEVADPTADKLAKAYQDATDPEEAGEEDAASQEDAEASDAEATDAEATDAEEDEESTEDAGAVEDAGAIEEASTTPCELPVLNKSEAAVAQPCLSTKDFMESLDLSQEQIRRVEQLSKTAGLAH